MNRRGELSAGRAVILFDFDGTLADSFPALLRVAAKLAVEENKPVLTAEDIQAFRRLHASDLIRRSGLPKTKIPFWLSRIRREMALETPDMGSFPGMKEALAQLREDGAALAIVTSNGEENVRQFLGNHQWETWFDLVETGSPLFGKARLIRRAARRLGGADPDRVWYVGDELRDIEAARAAGVRAAAVTWGFNDADILAAAKPDLLLARPADLPTLGIDGRTG